MTGGLTADDVIRLLNLHPLPGEGGMWAQILRDEHGSAIYFLLRPGDFSALHRLEATEVYHHYAGAPAELVTLSREDGLRNLVLGTDLDGGQRPSAVVAPGVWQGSRTLGPWTLLGTTMAPPFDEEGFVLGNRAELISAFPNHTDVISHLSRV